MKKLLLIFVIGLLLGFSWSDCNGAPVTSKGHYSFYVDNQPWYAAQTQGNPSSKPAISSVTRIAVNYGIAANQEIGLLRIDDKAVFPAASAATLYSEHNYGITYAYELSKLLNPGFDLRFQFEYDLPRKFVLHTAGQKEEDDSSFKTGATYFGLCATKETALKGIYLGGSLGIINSWTLNCNDSYDINEKGSSAVQITVGVDYIIPNTSITLYTTGSHIGKSNLVGIEDSTGFKAKDNQQDFITYGIRYDL